MKTTFKVSKKRRNYKSNLANYLGLVVLLAFFVLLALGCGKKGNPKLADELIVLGNISLTAERMGSEKAPSQNLIYTIDKDKKVVQDILDKNRVKRSNDLYPLKISCTRESQSELVAKLERKFLSLGEEKFSELDEFKTPTFSYLDKEMTGAATADYRIIFETPSGAKVGVTDTLRVISAGGELYFERFAPN